VLDLHGKTSAEAREFLGEFLLQCQHENVRHVLIIHGKGKDSAIPVLKNKLNNWLRQTEQVIAFCTATPRHGGSGALYLLLRRQR
jgi:DNA-nicking Smr family endonuclease